MRFWPTRSNAHNLEDNAGGDFLANETGVLFPAKNLARGREMSTFWHSLACTPGGHFVSGPMLFEVSALSCERSQRASWCCIREGIAYGRVADAKASPPWAQRDQEGGRNRCAVALGRRWDEEKLARIEVPRIELLMARRARHGRNATGRALATGLSSRLTESLARVRLH